MDSPKPSNLVVSPSTRSNLIVNTSTRSLETVVEMRGYLVKSRFDTKKPNPRKRYIILENEVLLLHEREGKHCYKKIPLEEIAKVEPLEESSLIVYMREVATAEKPGSIVRFDCPSEKERDEWLQSLEQSGINGDVTGLVLVQGHTNASIHHKYDLQFANRNAILGTGMCGDVRRIKRIRDGHFFAMKTVNLSGVNKYKLASLRREIDILKSLDHPHIARLYETYTEHNLCVRLVMEMCEGGELYARLHKRRRFTERYSCKLVTTMLKALNYLHLNNIVHRDLKLENWLFRNKFSSDNPEDDDIVLIDFGLSTKYKDENEIMTKKVGTCYYVAPEVLAASYHGGECDMWSLGVICWMLLSGEAPFPGRNDAEVRKKIKENKPPVMKKKIWDRVSDEAKDFVMKLLERDPEKRLSAQEALQHDWITVSGLERDISLSAHLESNVLENLKNYSKYHELKRIAMDVIAFNLDHQEIKNLTELFEEIDTDCSGAITFDDLFKTLQASSNVTEAEAREIFNSLDECGNGRIHVSEFVAGALQARYHYDEGLLAEAFSLFDTDNKGKVTVKDLRHMLGKLATEDRIDSIVKEFKETTKCDKDEITFNDFLVFMRIDGENDVNNYFQQTVKREKKKLDSKRLSKQSLLQVKKAMDDMQGI